MTLEERWRFERAAKIPAGEWGDPVFSDDDTWYETIQEAIRCYEDNGEEAPAYVWAARAEPIIQVDLDDIMRDAYDQAYEDWEWDGNGKEEFEAAIEKFNHDNRNNTVWRPDFSTAILTTELLAREHGRCPDCGGENLYGPVSDYWGCCCVDCGYELDPGPQGPPERS